MEKLYVIKIGGNVVDDESALPGVLKAFSALRESKILVHGGGKLATRLAADLGIPQQLVDGRRITDAETLRVVTMVYAGWVNKRIVALLQAQGCDAIGLSGADGNAILSDRRSKAGLDYGFVGDVRKVNIGLLASLLGNGQTPVLAPITHDGAGQLLNTNADTIAQETARALSGRYDVDLIYTFEKAGVLRDPADEGSVIEKISPDQYTLLKADGSVSGGMLPKLDNAFAAIASGIRSVTIGARMNWRSWPPAAQEPVSNMDKQRLHTVRQDALDLLCRLIETPSFSREEAATASLIGDFLAERGVPVEIQGNNVLARTRVYDPAKATWLLNSHHDTVKPAAGYTRDPFKASIEAGKIFGLGSNDAGGALCALIAAFLYFYDEPGTPFNLVLAATAEEEVSGAGGIESVLPALGKIDGALVGEPTKMELAVAERGLLVIDAEAAGVAGHAARGEGVNALYAALDDIGILRKHRFGKISPLLGPVTAQATAIETGNKAHNVVPDRCRFVIDVRVNECHTLEEVLGGLRSLLKSRLTPRSLRLRSSIIPDDHPLVRAGMSLGRKSYGSPTTSDKALMPFPALKTGPGDSARSHTPDEFIYLHELMDGVEGYIQLLMRSV